MKYKYILFYKPYNVLCQFTDDSPHKNQRQTLKDYINIPHIYSVGRLDLDSEGLLLLTNNPRVKHRLCEPSFAHPRTYWAQVENIPTAESLKQLEEGVIIKGKKTKKATASMLKSEPELPPRNPPIRYRQNIPTAWLELTLTEGRNRQVRRMTAAVGYPTLRLIRVKIGITQQLSLTLEGLNVGEYRELTTSEIKILDNL
ncbi:pseudouridine synthase [Cyanobacterium aponinum UTEX 3222]|uniref:Pseudouridine synthase n=2 Tax=Cyanobacterium aponinum TaxID=379064 RepID=K9Z5B0_CYAAP|nr:pseudouridine synthase [Cyanobacterium aponinum]WRL43716.1 pseudouridine synthase [Cyanobacterium aponinum UTEX 3222]AFZ54329.1 pseudouridine synthase Rsu [Cyanobacterium aponinum PCC 10605]MBD2394770.1 pseudouridine synthase [Cyanobacterium aponinum FACHB-4101]MTF38704.1 pseudouridine synthase [Cyanobacterium aponinum 0216]PHV62115.1 pseudouridine synthase [Cyanobacterium aponinum IPPAS B-1201]